MQFPAYVPAAVREKITHYLEGESERDIPGYVQLLRRAELRLGEISQSIEIRLARGEVEYLPSLREQMNEAVKNRDGLAKDVDMLQRLADDPRMREAFALLSDEFTEDHQFSGFIFSAWVARADYAIYRDRLRRAGEMKEEIAEKARSLASVIDRFGEIGVDGPAEFWSIPELLRRTDNRDVRSGNLHMWRGLRGRLLGDRREPTEDSTYPNADKPTTIEVRFVAPDDTVETDPEQQLRDTLRYIWNLSPTLPELLESVAKAAQSFTPTESGMIGAAIVSRQRSTKTEYLRAFANRLVDSGIALTTQVMQAMVPVANVAINSREVDVSYDDVRKALVKLTQ